MLVWFHNAKNVILQILYSYYVSVLNSCFVMDIGMRWVDCGGMKLKEARS